MNPDGNGPFGRSAFVLAVGSCFGFAISNETVISIKAGSLRELTAKITEIVICFDTVLAVYRVGKDVIDLRRIQILSLQYRSILVMGLPSKRSSYNILGRQMVSGSICR